MRRVWVGLAIFLAFTGTASAQLWPGGTSGGAGTAQSVSPYNTTLGYQSCLNSTGVYNTCIGYKAGIGITSGTNNTFVGDDYQTFTGVVTGNYNTVIGSDSLLALTSGIENVFVGSASGQALTTSNSNVGIGDDVLQSITTTGSNTAVGNAALQHWTGTGATAIGFNSVNAATGSAQETVAVGYGTFNSASFTGNNDTAVGYQAGAAVQGAAHVTLVGAGAGTNITSGAKNTCIGENACNGITTGQSNTILGYQSSTTLSATTATAFGLYSNAAIQLDYNITNAGQWTFDVGMILAKGAGTGAAAPTIASGACGATTNGTITGSNNSMQITIGAAATTTCTVTFNGGSVLAAAPAACIAYPVNAAAAVQQATVASGVYISAPTTAGFVLTGAVMASTNWAVLCM